MIIFDSSGNTHLLWEKDSEAWYLKTGKRYIRTYIPDSFEGTPGNPYYKGIAAEKKADGSKTTVLLMEESGRQGESSNRVFINYTVNPENGHLTGAYDINGNFLSIETSSGVDALNSLENKWDEKTTPNAEKKFNKLFDEILNPRDINEGTSNQALSIKTPSKFNKKSVDKITNFNPSTDTLEIDTDSFGIDSSATFVAGKNKKAVKKKLAKQDFDFLYDQKKGGLYFNENGSDKGFGDGGIIAVLKGAPDLTTDNLEFA